MQGWMQLLPASCELCGRRGRLQDCICPDCLADLPHTGSACERCGAQTPDEASLCGKCLQRPPLADRTVTAFHYAYPLDRLVRQFKYRQSLRLAKPLTGSLADCILERGGPAVDVLIPVPLHYRRQIGRGYNQATVICRLLEKRLNVPVDTQLVRRTRATRPMYALSVEQRRHNIGGAFMLTTSCPYRSIAIVDDVITSGATLNEIAGLLRRAGAEYIEFWALARAE